MSRKYEHVKVLEEEIFKMKELGKSNSEIKEHFGLTMKQLKNLINRHNRRKRNLELGILPKKKGRPRIQDSINNKDTEIKRLKMENALLRDFLYLAGKE